jgi:hypothetical protein
MFFACDAENNVSVVRSVSDVGLSCLRRKLRTSAVIASRSPVLVDRPDDRRVADGISQLSERSRLIQRALILFLDTVFRHICFSKRFF